MSNIERYVADQTEGGDGMVLDTSSDPARVICMCRTDKDADMIARALNASGGIEALRDLVDRQYDFPTHLSHDREWYQAFEQAKALLNAPSGAGEGVGSERDSSRAGDYRRPSARREEGTG